MSIQKRLKFAVFLETYDELINHVKVPHGGLK